MDLNGRVYTMSQLSCIRQVVAVKGCIIVYQWVYLGLMSIVLALNYDVLVIMMTVCRSSAPLIKIPSDMLVDCLVLDVVALL